MYNTNKWVCLAVPILSEGTVRIKLYSFDLIVAEEHYIDWLESHYRVYRLLQISATRTCMPPLSESRRTNTASNNEIWGSIELEKWMLLKILLYKAKLTGFWIDHYLWGGQAGEDDVAHPIQHFSCIHTTQLLDCLHIKDGAKRKSACSNMCNKSRINNQSGERRVSGWAWGGYHILYLNTYNGGFHLCQAAVWCIFM